MRTAIIVPARLASTRFPQKLLHEIRGRPVLLWTAERIRRVAPEHPLWFAVDGAILHDLVTEAGYDAVVTDPAHTCGTDRIGEANRSIRAECVINVQGDEPLVTGEQIRTLARLVEAGAEMATLGAAPSGARACPRSRARARQVPVICPVRSSVLRQGRKAVASSRCRVAERAPKPRRRTVALTV